MKNIKAITKAEAIRFINESQKEAIQLEVQDMSERMYKHMKNTVRDIKNITEKRDDMTDKEKLDAIILSLSLLESVDCGEAVLSDM